MVKDGIVLTENELRLMSLFSTLTGITPKDCIIDERFNRLIFVIDEGIKVPHDKFVREALNYLRKKTNKGVEIVEYSEDPVQLIKNALGHGGVLDVRITRRNDGTKVGVVIADPREKGAIVGKQGRNAERARVLARRYHDIERIQVS